MPCPSCSAASPPGAKFCGECGTALPKGCPACGAPTAPGAKFCGECGERLTPAAAAGAAAPVLAKPAPRHASPPLPTVEARTSPERRLVSVLFCDLVDSTSLSTEIDLEDYREVIGAYHKAAAAEVESAGGFVAKYMGDGVLAYFGYPTAREDDAERAVRAGLAICAAVQKLTAQGLKLKARVGVATGPVIVGDLLGTGSAQEQGISGETPNLAARLQGLAEPGQVVISALTHGLTGGLFDYADLGEVELKGFARPQPAFQVLSTNEAVGRFEALRSSRTPLVGREEELGLLLRRWERTVGGEPQVVLISAEPGVGKSRLVSAFREQIADTRHADLSAYCSPHAAESAFYPVIRALEARCGFASADSETEKLGKLAAFLAETGADAEPAAGALIGALLSLPADGVYPALDLSPQRIRDETIRVVTPLMMSGLSDAPTLTVFEDLHWADPSSLELLRGAVRDGAKGGPPQLLLITFRPEYQPPQEWLGRPDVTNLTLTRLRSAEAGAMVTRVADGRRLPEPVLREILERAEGVPLFIEEITRAVLEAEESQVEGSAARVVVPATLQASLAGRLDRLGAAKELAQVGAAIGREFAVELLQAVVGWPEDALEAGLDQLVDADVIFPTRAGEDRGYIFKHALVQDVAYAALLRSQRQTLHGRIADMIVARMPAEAAARPERIARHLGEAARPREALPAWRSAAVKSFAGGSWREGLSQLRQAMTALATLPEGEDRDRLELDLQMIAGGVSQGTLGHSAPDAQNAYERAYDLARKLGDRWITALAGNRLWIGAYGQNDLEGVILAVEKVLTELPADASPLERAIVSSQLCTPYTYIGDFIKSQAVSADTLSLVENVDHLIPQEYHFMRPTNSSLNSALAALLPMGFITQYNDLAAQQEIDAPRQGQMSRTITLTLLIYTRYLIGEWDLIAGYVRQLSDAVSEMEGSAYYLELGRLMEIRMASRAGDREAGAAVDALVNRPAVAFAKQHIPRYMMIAGDIHADLGDHEKARGYYAEALTGGPFGVQHWLDSEVQRRMGDLAMVEGDRAAAAQWFEAAVETAQRQSATLFELRAAKRLAELHLSEDASFDCAALLGPICARFPEPCAELEAARVMCAAPVVA